MIQRLGHGDDAAGRTASRLDDLVQGATLDNELTTYETWIGDTVAVINTDVTCLVSSGAIALTVADIADELQLCADERQVFILRLEAESQAQQIVDWFDEAQVAMDLNEACGTSAKA